MINQEENEPKKADEEKHIDYDPYQERYDFLTFAEINNTFLLDIGTGEGFLARIAAEKFNCRVISVDCEKKQIDIAKDLSKTHTPQLNITFQEEDATELSFENNTFDTVVCYNALHHMSAIGRKKAVNEMFRVSKKSVAIAELHDSGATFFDTVAHPGLNHREMQVDLEELESDLKKYGKVIRKSTNIFTFFLIKNPITPRDGV